MRQQIQERVEVLKNQFARGQEKLSQLENESLQLQQTLLRISGAIQVLEEELSKADGEKPSEGSQ